MRVVIVHGQSHQGSTCHIARMLAAKLGGDVKEFFLPKDFGDFCTGCCTCFEKSETQCPHYARLKPITEAMDEADVLILASPVYVYHATGAMKAFLDHYGYRWMVHRPEEKMFSKQAICISTAAGAGLKSTNRDMGDSLFFWGCAKIYRMGVAVAATSWAQVTPGAKKRVEKGTDAIARKVKRHLGKARPGVKTRAFFTLMRMVQRNGWNPADKAYWQEKGWTAKARPWKEKTI